MAHDLDTIIAEEKLKLEDTYDFDRQETLLMVAESKKPYGKKLERGHRSII